MPRIACRLANSSGVVGRYLTATVGTGLSGHIPALEGLPHYNSDGYGTHMYIPWWLWDKQKDLGFPRGYHVELGGGFGMPAVGSFQATCQRHEGYGLGLKKAIREEYGTSASFSGRPGDSSPPVTYVTLSGSTPYSSARIPRIHTLAVNWYSGHPKRLPRRSDGSRMPLRSWTQMLAWRNIRDGNTGIATNGSPLLFERQYDENDISETWNSAKRACRKNVSSTSSGW